MAKFNFKEPPEGGIDELREYISLLVDELNYVLENIDDENINDEFLKTIQDA